MFARIDGDLAAAVAGAVGVTAPRGAKNGPATRPSPALSMANTVKTIKGRVIAALVAPGVAGRELAAVRKALEAAGAKVEIVAPGAGPGGHRRRH